MIDIKIYFSVPISNTFLAKNQFMAVGPMRTFGPEDVRSGLSYSEESGARVISGILQSSFDSTNEMFDSFASSMAKCIQSSANELQITGILTLLDEHAGVLIQSTEILFQVLTSLQTLIDHSSKKHTPHHSAESQSHDNPHPFQVTDTIRAHALTTYTNLLIIFSDITVNIRSQYLKALVDMTTRRNIKKKDYVNSQLRTIACECLNELELAFPGEVAAALRITDWLSGESPTYTPSIVEAAQEESLACFENYTKLFFTCCTGSGGSGKQLTKTISLVLDSLEFASVWFRVHVAIEIWKFIITNNFYNDSVEWTHAVVVHHFERLLESKDVHQVHAFLHVSLPFVGEWDPSFRQTVTDRLFAITVDPHVKSVPVKLLATCWLSSLIEHPTLSEIVYSGRSVLVPQKADSFQLVEAKLSCILLFANTNNRIPRNIVRLLVPIEYQIGSGIPKNTTGVVFRFLTRILILFGHLEDFGIPEYLNELIRSSCISRVHAFLPSIACMLEILSSFEVRQKLLENFGKFINEIQPPTKTLFYFSLTTYLAMSKSLDPEYVISSTERLLGSQGISDWNDGLRILEIIRQIVLCHSTLAQDRILKLLATVASSVNNVDIKDRACLYQRFIQELSSEKQRKEFISPSPDSLVIGDLARGDLITTDVPTRETRQNFSEIINFKKNFLKRKNLKIFDNNWAVFDDEANPVTLPFTLQFDPSSDDHTLTSLFGVEIQFSICDGYVPFESVRIPYLEKPALHMTGAGFPYSYDINLPLRTTAPMPAEFQVSIVFTDAYGQSHEGELEPFTVAFEDLFQPCPKHEWTRTFSRQWKDPFAKLLPIGQHVAEKFIKERLSHFLPKTSSRRNSREKKFTTDMLPPLDPFDFEQEAQLHGNSAPATSTSPVVRNAMIFIAPNSYLLMRFMMGTHTSVVWLCTDRSDLLLLIDGFFDRWVVAAAQDTNKVT